MKKAFFERNNDNTRYMVPDYMKTKNEEIYCVNEAINPWQDMNVRCDRDTVKKTIFIWATDSFLERIKLNFDAIDEDIAFEKNYNEYRKRRWKEMPQIEISIENFEYYKAEWKRLEKELPRYVIVTLDKSGPLDKLEIMGKDELSEQDKEDVKRENDEYLAWKEAEALYNYDHERVDFTWRSPVDNMYDADIAKYLGRTEGFVEHKDYTKEDVIVELQEKLKKGEPVYLIVHWLKLRCFYRVKNSDVSFDALLERFWDMDSYPDSMISREKLQEVVDRLSLGQDVVLD